MVSQEGGSRLNTECCRVQRIREIAGGFPGKQSGRTLEIQRLIGRALRAAVDIKSLPPVTIKFDCDVISADGGTRTTRLITGAWVALYDALRWTVSQGIISELPKINQVAAISVGVVYGEPRVDLEYVEDSKADFDMNVVLDDSGRVIEVQGTAEDRAVSRAVLNGLLDLAEGGIKQIMSIQREVISKPVDN